MLLPVGLLLLSALVDAQLHLLLAALLGFFSFALGLFFHMLFVLFLVQLPVGHVLLEVNAQLCGDFLCNGLCPDALTESEHGGDRGDDLIVAVGKDQQADSGLAVLAGEGLQHGGLF